MASGRDLTALRKDGVEIPVDVSLSPFQVSGRMTLIAAVRDVTERQQAEQKVRRSEQLHRLLTEHAQDILYRYRLTPWSVGLEYISPSVERVTGVTPDECYADRELILRLLHPDDRPLFQAAIASPAAAMGSLVFHLIAKNGELHWLEHRIAPALNEAGELCAVDGIARDVTQQELAFRALRDSEARWHAVVDNLPFAVWVHDKDGRCTL